MGHQKNQATQTTEGKEAQPQLEPVGFYKHTEDGLKSLILIERVNSSRKPWYVFSLYTGAESKHQFQYITTIGVYKESDEIKGGFKGLGGEISGNRDGTEDTRVDSSGIRNGVNRNRKSVVSLSGGAIVSDGIEAGTVEVSGKVNMTGYLSTTTSVGYTVVGALDSDAFIEVKGNWYSSSDHVEDNQAETIYEVARPGDGYTITDQDFKAFKINGQSGHDNTASGNLGLYMGEELNSLDYYRESYNGHVLAWRGPETGEPAGQTYTIYWDDQLGNVSTSQQEYGKNLNMPYTPIDTSGQREFIGWFTEAEGGTQVTTSTVYQIEGNTTYYAHWKEKSDGPFKIYGKVTNANMTDEPLQNVSVRLVQGSANNVIGTATTDKDGNYVIENVPI